MGISSNVIDNHISSWEAKLSASYRRRWPSRLFRHEALENAIRVLQSGQLLSRRDASSLLVRDVAPDEIINSTDAAHGYVRLYFRPRTPTQYRIEGIRREEEIWNGKHAPVLYMFVFRSNAILTKSNVRLSSGNMQVPGTSVLDGDQDFACLNFDKIYHEGSYNTDTDADIKIWRCAEVLSDQPIVLDDALEAVVCRSHAERQTLLYMLGDSAALWANKITVVTQPGIFNAEYAYVEAVDLNSNGVAVRFHPRRKAPMATWVRAEIRNLHNLVDSRTWSNRELDLRRNWNFVFEPSEGRYLFNLWIDNESAYSSVLTYGEQPF